MGDKYKVMAAEKNGSELLDLTEVELSAVNTDFNNTSNGFIASDVQGAIEEAKRRTFLMNLHKVRTINSSFSNSGFWDTWPAQYASASYSGFGSACYPFTLPFNCKIVEVNMIFRKANFDFNATAGVIRHDIELRDHQYNGSTVDSLITVPFGSFSGNNTGDSTHKFTIPAANLVFNSGNNVFEKGLILGARFVKSSGGVRAINSFVDPIMQIILEEIL